MKVLGIDTILHDACVAVIEDGHKVLSNEVKHTIMSSDFLLDLSILHLKELGLLIKNALKKANCQMKDISLIAVNNFGSLFSNVAVGVGAANVLACLYDIPIIDIHHQEGHFFSNWLERDQKAFQFPIVVLSSSGGHSSIILILNNHLKFKEISRIEGMKEKKKNKPNFRGIGALYGFVANNLGLGGPIDSGSLISKTAKKGNPDCFDFSNCKQYSKVPNLDFTELEKSIAKVIAEEKRKYKILSPSFISDLAASFEKTISQMIIDDLVSLAKKYKAKEIHLVGGVSANNNLRNKLCQQAKLDGFITRWPKKKEYSTDNAAMIANLGYWKYQLNPKKYFNQRSVSIESNLKLENIAVSQFLEKNKELK